MKYEITEEQIKELAKGNAKVQKWFPEAFEDKFEIGKWYKSKKYDKVLFFVESISNVGVNGYGLNYVGDWVNSKERFANEKDSPAVCLATESEVFEALKREAVKQGFKKGVKYISPINKFENICDGYFRFDTKNNSLTSNGIAIFNDGKWATIIKEKTLSKSEAEKLINELKNDDYTYKIK